MDLMNGHFSPINGLESFNGIQFSLCGTATNLILAHRDVPLSRLSFSSRPVALILKHLVGGGGGGLDGSGIFQRVAKAFLGGTWPLRLLLLRP